MNRTFPPILRKSPFEHDRQDIEKLINTGKSDAEIALIYGVTKDTIWSRRKRWHLPSGSEIKEKQLVESLRVLWENYYSVSEIAETLTISEQTVYSKLTQYRIREISRLGVDATTMAFTSLKQGVDPDKEDEVIVITHNRAPKWALVPFEQYKDLVEGTYHQLREE